MTLNVCRLRAARKRPCSFERREKKLTQTTHSKEELDARARRVCARFESAAKTRVRRRAERACAYEIASSGFRCKISSMKAWAQGSKEERRLAAAERTLLTALQMLGVAIRILLCVPSKGGHSRSLWRRKSPCDGDEGEEENG
eukprot:6199928-Pleurochrysis_carterae.AAC.1